MIKVITFGGKGMVGSRVIELLQDDFQFIVPGQHEVDITDDKILKNYLSKEKPQVVINFAAITDVGGCEIERENKNGNIWKVNALAPGLLSSLSKTLNFYLIQISTDMVFAGSVANKGPYSENSPVSSENELNWYGASKAMGEKLVRKNNPKSAIVRINNPVGARFKEKKDYAEKIVSLYDEGKLYHMFEDQFLTFTFIDELTEALKKLITGSTPGVFHVSSADVCTPYEFAEYLLLKTRNVQHVVKKSSIEEFVKGKDPRRYPQFGGLTCKQTEASLSIEFSTWKNVIDKLSSYLQLP